MQFDATLNLAWAILGLFALTATGYVAITQNSRQRVPRGLLIVGLIVTALFPYISASDDILRLDAPRGLHATTPGVSTSSVANAAHHGSQNGNRHQVDDLLRLYETLDTPLVCRLAVLAFQFLLIALMLTIVCGRATRTVPEIAGRSPPLAAAL